MTAEADRHPSSAVPAAAWAAGSGPDARVTPAAAARAITAAVGTGSAICPGAAS